MKKHSQKVPPKFEKVVAAAERRRNGDADRYNQFKVADKSAKPDVEPPPKPKPTWRDTAVTAAVLQTKTFQPIKFILRDLIPEGVTLLVSRPKLGKSWMALDICLAATSNRFTLGGIKPMQGDVLYLPLEDSERRLQSRVDKLLGAFNAKWPERLTINTKWRRTDDGGIDDLKEWCDSVKEPEMVVIDVFAKVRPANAKNKQLYEADYAAVGALQAFAIDRGIAVVLVHHDRKMEAEDPFDTVSGTQGLTGAADTILILKRSANGVTLYARGRDIEEAELAVQFTRNTCRWTILGQAADVHRSDERKRVVEALKNAGKPLGPNEIMISANFPNRNTTDKLLGRMADKGDIERVGRGKYALPSTPLSDVSDQSRSVKGVRCVRSGKSDRSDCRPYTLCQIARGKKHRKIKGQPKGGGQSDQSD